MIWGIPAKSHGNSLGRVIEAQARAVAHHIEDFSLPRPRKPRKGHSVLGRVGTVSIRVIYGQWRREVRPWPWLSRFPGTVLGLAVVCLPLTHTLQSVASFAGFFQSTLDEVAAEGFGMIMVFVVAVDHTHLASGAAFPPSPPRRARSGARGRPVECFPDAAMTVHAVCRPAMAGATEPETAWEGSCQSRHAFWGAPEVRITRACPSDGDRQGRLQGPHAKIPSASRLRNFLG